MPIGHHLLRRVLIIGLCGLVLAVIQSPDSNPPPLQVSLMTRPEILQIRIVEDLDGSKRREGFLHFIAGGDFDVAKLTAIGPDTVLVEEGEVNRLGTKHLAILVPNDQIDVALARLESLPGVVAASKDSIAYIDSVRSRD